MTGFLIIAYHRPAKINTKLTAAIDVENSEILGLFQLLEWPTWQIEISHL